MITPAERQQIKRMYLKDKVSIRDIATVTGHTYNAIHLHLVRNKIKIRRRSRTSDQLVIMYYQDRLMTIDEIAEQFAVSPCRVRHILYSHNVNIRDGRDGRGHWERQDNQTERARALWAASWQVGAGDGSGSGSGSGSGERASECVQVRFGVVKRHRIGHEQI